MTTQRYKSTTLVCALALLTQGSALGEGPFFNDDDHPDIVVGVPGQDLPPLSPDAGAVEVIYGPPGPGGHQRIYLHQVILAGGGAIPNQVGMGFGRVVVWGRFNGDLFYDVAIGMPDYDVDGMVNAGQVIVLFGSPTGISMTGAQRIRLSDLGFKGTAANDRFGAALTVGDFNGDLTNDLAIGAPGRTVTVIRRTNDLVPRLIFEFVPAASEYSSTQSTRRKS